MKMTFTKLRGVVCMVAFLSAATSWGQILNPNTVYSDFCHAILTQNTQQGCSLDVPSSFLIIDNVSVRCSVQGSGISVPDMAQALLFMKINGSSRTLDVPLIENGPGILGGRTTKTYAGVVTGPYYADGGEGALLDFSASRFSGNVFSSSCTVTVVGRLQTRPEIEGGN